MQALAAALPAHRSREVACAGAASLLVVAALLAREQAARTTPSSDPQLVTAAMPGQVAAALASTALAYLLSRVLFGVAWRGRATPAADRVAQQDAASGAPTPPSSSSSSSSYSTLGATTPSVGAATPACRNAVLSAVSLRIAERHAAALAAAKAHGSGAPPCVPLTYKSPVHHCVVSAKVRTPASATPAEAAAVPLLIAHAVRTAAAAQGGGGAAGGQAPLVTSLVAVPGCVHVIAEVDALQPMAREAVAEAIQQQLERRGMQMLGMEIQCSAAIRRGEERGCGVRLEPVALPAGCAEAQRVVLLLPPALTAELRAAACDLRVVLSVGAGPHQPALVDVRLRAGTPGWPHDGRLPVVVPPGVAGPLLMASLLVRAPAAAAAAAAAEAVDAPHGRDELLVSLPLLVLSAGACAEVEELWARIRVSAESEDDALALHAGSFVPLASDLGLLMPAPAPAPALGPLGVCPAAGVPPPELLQEAAASVNAFLTEHSMHECMSLLTAQRARLDGGCDGMDALKPGAPRSAAAPVAAAAVGAPRQQWRGDCTVAALLGFGDSHTEGAYAQWRQLEALPRSDRWMYGLNAARLLIIVSSLAFFLASSRSSGGLTILGVFFCHVAAELGPAALMLAASPVTYHRHRAWALVASHAASAAALALGMRPMQALATLFGTQRHRSPLVPLVWEFGLMTHFEHLGLGQQLLAALGRAAVVSTVCTFDATPLPPYVCAACVIASLAVAWVSEATLRARFLRDRVAGEAKKAGAAVKRA